MLWCHCDMVKYVEPSSFLGDVYDSLNTLNSFQAAPSGGLFFSAEFCVRCSHLDSGALEEPFILGSIDLVMHLIDIFRYGLFYILMKDRGVECLRKFIQFLFAPGCL